MLKKKELLETIAGKAETTPKVVDGVLGALADTILTEVTSGSAVSVHGLGKFSPVYSAARVGRNPSTGEALNIAEKFSVKFKAEGGTSESAFANRFSAAAKKNKKAFIEAAK